MRNLLSCNDRRRPAPGASAFCDGVWVRIACRLIRDENVKAKEHMLDAYPSLKEIIRRMMIIQRFFILKMRWQLSVPLAVNREQSDFEYIG